MEVQSTPLLRPLRLGELLDRAIRLYRANFLTFIGIIALVYVPVALLQTAGYALQNNIILRRVPLSGTQFSRYYTLAFILPVLLWLIETILVQGVAAGALARAVSDSYLGKKTGILEAYRGIRGSWLRLIGALVLLGIVLVALIAWSIVPCIGWLTGPGMLLFLVLAIHPLVPAAVVLEDQGVFQALRRAWSLARRRFWPVLGYILMLYLFSLIVVNGPATIIGVLLTVLSESLGDAALQRVLTTVIGGLLQLMLALIYLPLRLTAFNLIYFDLRVRTEGFDLALLSLASTDPVDASEVMVVPVPPASERLITAPDIGNFALLTLAGAGLYIFFSFILTGVLMLFLTLYFR